MWTQHTHPDVTADDAAGPGLAGGGQQGGVQTTTVQPAVTAAGAAVLAGGGQQGAATAASGPQPSTDRLRTTKPPTGRPTAPQPALPASPADAAYRAAVTTVQQANPYAAQPGAGQSGPGQQPYAAQPGSFEHTIAHTPDFGNTDSFEHTVVHTPDFAQPGMQPTTVQQASFGSPAGPTAVQPGYPQPGYGHQGGGDGPGTQVLFGVGGEPWQVPAGANNAWHGLAGPGQGAGPGTGGGPGDPGNRYGYQQAKRRRRLLIGGVSAGAVAAVAVIAVIVMNLGGPTAPSTANTAATAPPSASPSAAASTPASPTASPSPSVTPNGSLLSDGQSGISYSQLTAPWAGPSCPPSLNNGTFTWTAGQYATAGQVNGGSLTWYGEACSGPLPQQYGYTSTAQLQTMAENLAEAFQNSYYNALGHTATGGVDQPIQVSGHAGWEVTYDIAYTNGAAQGVTWADEQAAVVVVDTGTGTPAVFFTSIPQNLGENNVSTLVSSLQVTAAAATPGTTPTATDTAFGGGADGGAGGGFGDGGGGGGNGNGFGHSNP